MKRSTSTGMSGAFVHCSNPIMYDDRTCLIATQSLTYSMREAIQDLMEPIRFGQAMADRLRGLSNDYKVKFLLTFNRGDYKDMSEDGRIDEQCHAAA